MTASQKIRTGLVELRTNTGSVYAKPSLWERVYLVWMFRNFRCLPKEVLSLRQRRLIDKLCQAAVKQRTTVDTCIIGVVENICLAPRLKEQVAVTAGKLIEMTAPSVEIDIPRAVAAGGMPTRRDRPADRGEAARWISPSAKVEEISPPKRQTVRKDETEKPDSVAASDTRSGAPTRPLAWVLAGAFVVAAAGILFHFQTQARPLPLAGAPPVAVEAPLAATAPAPVTPVALPAPTLLSTAVDPAPPAAISESKLSHPPIATPQPESKHGSLVVGQPPIATPEIAVEDSPSEPRLQVAQPPASGFRYPVAPSSTITGKVSLRAVIATDGSVRKVDVLSGNRILAIAAVQAVRHWQYPAPEMNGHPVEAETNIAINFVGDDAVSISFPAAR